MLKSYFIVFNKFELTLFVAFLDGDIENFYKTL